MFGMRSSKREDADKDLGFGAAVASSSAERLLNRDGSFNSRREGLPFIRSLHLFDLFLTMSWPRFSLLVAMTYLVTNTFAAAYVILGPGALEGALDAGRTDSFPRAFFFSVHTLSTVGYGHIVPASTAANILMTLESMFGLFGIALTTGLVFARFARPVAKILFSANAIVAPYRDGHGLMFRIANQRSTQIIELEATVVFSRMVDEDGRSSRRFYPLPLERDKVVFFPLAWTVVHPIDKKSPLYELTSEECMRADAEIMVLLKGIDETFSQMVHTRSSFKAREIIWSAKFADIYLREGLNIVGIDIGRLSELQQITA